MSTALKVCWPDVETAFERNAVGLHSYIERATGQVLVVVEGAADDAEHWALITANQEAYLKIEPASSREQYRWMELFVASVTDIELKERLLVATDGKGAFRRFKDALLGYPEERERWFTFRADLLHMHIKRWFEQKQLEPDPPCPWADVILPAVPAEPLIRSTPSGEGPADVLRRQLKALVDVVPAGELYPARVFLEFLRDRGSADLSATRGRLDPRKPFRRRAEGGGAGSGGESSISPRALEPEVKGAPSNSDD